MNRILTEYESFINITVLTLLSISFVTIDWNVGIFTFSDFILISLLIVLALTKNIYIRFMDLKIIIPIIALLITNVAYHYLTSDIGINPSIAALIRLSFYLVSTLIIYNFININELRNELLYANNIIAMLIILIGAYISLALLLEADLPYKFFWAFTRSDTQSYMFRGANKVIRTRSIFSEPSHFGYYLNVILGVNLFNRVEWKHIFWFNSVLIVALISTLSYSTLAITLIILLIYFIRTLKKDVKILADKRTIIVIVLLGFAFFVFRDSIYTTMVTRTRDIYMGYDNSAIERIIESWVYVNRENILFGNGLGQTPNIFNNYAYMLSDIGIIAFILSIVFTLYLMTKNLGLGILFVMLNFQKGGYISPSFWLMLLLVLVFSFNYKAKPYSLFLGGRIDV